MSDSQLQKQEIQDARYHQKQLWRMRWWYFALLGISAIAALLASSAIVCIVIMFAPAQISPFSIINPVIASIMPTSAFWILMQTLARFLFPMRKREFEIAREKLHLAEQRKNLKELISTIYVILRSISIVVVYDDKHNQDKPMNQKGNEEQVKEEIIKKMMKSK